MPTPPRTALVAAALLAVYLVWGSTYLAIRVAVQTLPPFLLAGVRFLVAGTLLYAFSSIRRGGARGAEGAVRSARPSAEADPIGPAQWGAATLVGGLLLLGGNGLVVWAEQTVPSGLAALLIATVPLWTALLGRVFLRERMAGLSVAGVLLGFSGVALLVAPGGEGADPAGTIALCLAAVSWAVGSVWSPRLPLPKRPLVATSLEMLTGGALLSAVAVAGGELGRFDPAAVTAASWAALAYLVVFGSLVAFTAYVWLLANVRSDLTSTYAYVNPLIAVLLGWALLGEAVTSRTLLGGGVVVVAVGLVWAGRPRQGRTAATADAAAPEQPPRPAVRGAVDR